MPGPAERAACLPARAFPTAPQSASGLDSHLPHRKLHTPASVTGSRVPNFPRGHPWVTSGHSAVGPQVAAGEPRPPQPFQTPPNVHVAPLPATPQEQSVALRSPTKAPGLCPGPGRSTLACTPRGPQHPRASSTPGDPRRAGPPLRSGRPRAASVQSDGRRRPHSTRLPRRSVRLSYLAPRGRPGSAAAAPRRPPRPAAECGGNLCLVQPASATQPRNSR